MGASNLRFNGPCVIVVLTALMVAAVLGLPTVVSSQSSCNCPAVRSPMRELFESAMVFRGRVTTIDTDPLAPAELRVKFTVTNVWKGPHDGSFEVFTAHADGCGFPFIVGSDYLVYATNQNADGTRLARCEPVAIRLFTDQCSRTKLFDPVEAAQLECPPPVSTLAQSEIERIALDTYGLERNHGVPARIVGVELKAACQTWQEQSCSWFLIDDHAPLWTVTMYGEGICTPRCPPLSGDQPCNPPPRNGFSVTIDGRNGDVLGGGCIQLRIGDVDWLYFPFVSNERVH